MCVCTCVCVRFGSLFTGLPIITFTVRINPWETLAQMESSGTVPLPRLSLPFLATSNILSLSLSLSSTYILYTAARMFGKCFSTVQRRHRASYEFPMQGTRIMRVEAREEREISIGIFLLESLPEDDDGMTRFVEDYRGRNSRPIPRCGTRFYIFSIDTLSRSGEEGMQIFERRYIRANVGSFRLIL